MRLVVLLLCCWVPLVDAKEPHFEDTLVESIIVNHSVTRFGQSFYRKFVMEYRELNGPEQHGGMVIKERPSAFRGSRIRVLLARKVVVQLFLPPSARDIEAYADGAAQRLVREVKKRQALAAIQPYLDPDLAADEF